MAMDMTQQSYACNVEMLCIHYMIEEKSILQKLKEVLFQLPNFLYQLIKDSFDETLWLHKIYWALHHAFLC